MTSSGWPEVALGDVADVSWGNTSTTKKAYVDAGFRAYSASGPDGFVDWAEHHDPGVVLSAIGAQCGKTWWAEGSWTCIKNTIWFRSRSSEVESRFLFYATSDPGIWPKRGAAQPFISQGDARALRLRLPSLSVQRRIVGVLSAIDDLIANNRRRIEILEEMARLTYREWFVYFRFPHHERVELVDSELGPIPEGWDVARLEECCLFQDGRAIAKNARGSGSVPVYGANGVIGTTALNANAPSCTVMGKIGSCGALHRSVGDCWVTNNAFAVLPGRWEHPLLVWLGLREIDFKPLIGGAANPYLPVKNFGHLPQCVPPSSVIEAFVELVAPMYALVDVVRHQNEVLAEARDLLLQRLVSGEVDVSSLDLDLKPVA